jgi:hypothetical protein
MAKSLLAISLASLVGEEELYTEQDRTTFGHMTKEEAQEYKSNFFADLSSMLD